MPDRTVSYNFRANFGQFSAGLAAMGKSVESTAVKLTALDRNGQKMRAGLTQLGSTGGKVGLVFAAGVAVAIGAAANFEQAMSNVAAATHETSENMALLRQAAIDAGQATQFSATEAAAAVENLAKAGVSTADILGGGLTGAMDLAAAGGLDVASAAEIAATALTQFKLQGADVPHVADLLAAAAGKAQGDVSDMSMALKQSGLVAAQMGVSIEETTGTLALFASAGLLGSDAGTSFRTMLLRMANPTKESAQLMESLGIAAYDAQGNFVGLESLAGQLQGAFEGKTQAERDSALATIFGSDAIRAASVLYKEGAAGVADWTNKVDDQGYAAETAAIKMDNLKGDIEQFTGALETALIGAGSGGQGPLRELVQDATNAVNAFNDLPAPVQSSATALAALVAVTGGGLWFGSKVIQGVANTKEALSNLGVQAGSTRGALATISKGIEFAAIGLAVEGLTSKIEDLRDVNLEGDINRNLEALAGGETVGNLDNVGKYLRNVNDGFEHLKQTTLGWVPFTDGPFQQAQDNLSKIDEALASMVESGNAETAAAAFQQIVAAGDEAGVSATEVAKSFDQYKVALNNAQIGDLGGVFASLPASIAGTVGALAGYADGTAGAGDAADDAAQQIADMVEAMQDQADAAVAAFDAITNYRQAMKEAAKQAKESDAGIQGNSKAALENRNQLSNLISSWNSLDQTVTDNLGKFKQARDNFVQTATAMGVPEKAAKRLWQEMAKIPASKVVPTSAPGAAAAANDAERLANQLDRLHDRTITVRVNQIGGVTSSAGGHSSAAPGDGPKGPTRSSSVSRSVDSLGVTVVPTLSKLTQQAEDKAAQALALLAKNSQDAGDGTKGLKHRLKELEEKLRKASAAADRAHDALDSLKDQKASLSASVSGALTNDPFGGDLAGFSAQVGADTADAQAMLAALKVLVQNGVDPHSAFFQQLAASGNVSLVQQFAALTRAELANYAQSFATGQAAVAAAGQFVGEAAFNDLIKAQSKVVTSLDNSVKHLTQTVNKLERAVDKMGKGGDGKGGGHDSTRTRTRVGGL